MKKKMFVVIALVVIAAMVLAACGGSPTPPPSASQGGVLGGTEAEALPLVEVQLHLNPDEATSIVKAFVRMTDNKPKTVTLLAANGEKYVLNTEEEYPNLSLTSADMLGDHPGENKIIVGNNTYDLIFQAGQGYDYFITKEVQQ